MATRSKKKTDKKPAIPAAGKRAAPTTDDLLGALAASTVKTKKKASKPQRSALALPDDVQEAVAEFVEKKTIFDLVESAFTPVKDDAKQAVWAEYCKLWHKGGVIPQNPRIEIKKDGKVDCEAMFILSQRFYPQVDLTLEEGETPSELAQRARDGVIADLTTAGVDEDIATDFVDNELDFAPEQGCRSFRELARGHKDGKVWVEASDVEKSVATKMVKTLLGQDHEPITEEERNVALYIEPNVTVKPDCLTRLAGRNGYARTAEEIEAFCAVVNPVYYLSRAKFAVSDTPVDRNHRLVGVLADIMGLAQQEDG